MSVNSLKGRLDSGQSAVGGWCTTPSPHNAELLATSGFDYVGIDLQHGLIDRSAMTSMLMAVGHTGATPVVRVPANEADYIGRALDSGAEAIVIPMVNSTAEAARAGAACRYPPDGNRSYGPVRASLFLNESSTTQDVNRQVLCLPMIETGDGLGAAEDICAVDGVDGVYVGPVDLALSMGFGLAAQTWPSGHGKAIDRILNVCRQAGKIAAIHADSGDTARRYLAAGFQMVSISSDARIFRRAAEAELESARHHSG